MQGERGGMRTVTLGTDRGISAMARAGRRMKPYLFVLPILLFAVGFVYYPFFRTFLYSFSAVNVMGEITSFAGFDNYRYLFSRREFGTALSNTLRLTAMNVPLTMFFTLLLGRLLKEKRFLGGLFETMIAATMAVSMGSAALTFRVMLNPTVGWINSALGISLRWYEDRNTALYGILLLTVWMGIGFNFLLFLAAFRNVDRDVTDQARLDGAGPARVFFSVELPLVSPTLLYAVCTNTILALMTSGPVMILTRGGPSRSTTTLIYLMYTTGYGSGNYAMAACVAAVTFLLTLAFTLAGLWADGKRGDAK